MGYPLSIQTTGGCSGRPPSSAPLYTPLDTRPHFMTLTAADGFGGKWSGLNTFSKSQLLWAVASREYRMTGVSSFLYMHAWGQLLDMDLLHSRLLKLIFFGLNTRWIPWAAVHRPRFLPTPLITKDFWHRHHSVIFVLCLQLSLCLRRVVSNRNATPDCEIKIRSTDRILYLKFKNGGKSSTKWNFSYTLFSRPCVRNLVLASTVVLLKQYLMLSSWE